MKIKKVSNKDFMGFSWFEVISDKSTYKVKALDKNHALKIHLQLRSLNIKKQNYFEGLSGLRLYINALDN